MARPPGRASLAGLQSGAPAHAGPRLLLDVPLRLERRLPLPGTVEVGVGERVSPDTVVATAPNTPSRLHVLDLPAALDQQLRPDELHDAVLVQPGQPVYVGQVIASAARPGWFEREQLTVTSPVNGIVEFISPSRAQVVIRINTEVTQDRIALPVANMLSIDYSDLPTFATCRPGQAVEPGDLLAKTSGLRPMGTEFRSPVAGIVESVSGLSGLITIVRERKPLALRAALDGWVERVFPGYGAVVTANGHRVLGVLGLGGKSWGELECLTEATPVGQRQAGKVVAVAGPTSGSFLTACRKAGARGVIAPATSARELQEFLGRPLAAEIVTGPGTLPLGQEATAGIGAGLLDEDTSGQGMTVIVTEGFGRLPMDARTWQVLCAHQGRLVSVDGLTQIRAGVVRPAVLLPVGPLRGLGQGAQAGRPPELGTGLGAAAAEAAASAQAAPVVPASLVAGQRVRIVRHPYFGLYGTVVEPPRGLTRLETEVEARVITIHLDDGRKVRVAEANVEY